MKTVTFPVKKKLKKKLLSHRVYRLQTIDYRLQKQHHIRKILFFYIHYVYIYIIQKDSIKSIYGFKLKPLGLEIASSTDHTTRAKELIFTDKKGRLQLHRVLTLKNYLK